MSTRHHKKFDFCKGCWLLAVVLWACAAWSAAEAQTDGLWIGGQRGLAKMDAVSGSLLLLIGSQHENDVAALAVDDQRYRVWALMEDGRLLQYGFDGTLLRTITLPPVDDDGEPEIENADLQVVPADGSIWVGAEELLAKYALDGTLLVQQALNREISGLALDENAGNLWVGTQRELLRYDADGVMNGQTWLGFGRRVKDLAFSATHNHLWVALRNYLYQYDADGQLIQSVYLRQPSRLRIDGDGNVWAATKRHVYRFDPQGGNQTLVDGSSMRVHDFAIDSDDNSVWVMRFHILEHFDQDGQFLQRHRGHRSMRMLAIGHVDAVAPTLSIDAPAAGALVPPQPSIALSYFDLASGIDTGSITLTVNGVPVAVTCNAATSGASCTPDVALTAPDLTLSVTVADQVGNVSAPASVQLKLDTDQDGFADDVDAFPNDPNESSDLDGDGIGDNADTDRDGDGFPNDTELLVGYDPDDAGSVPPDLDGDFIPDSIDDDRDGDGVANNQDLYPDDATRFRLAAIAGVVPVLQGTEVRIDWQAAADVANLAGYNIYRLPANSDAATLLNASPVNTLSFVDSSVVNGAGYRYRVVAVDHRAVEGDAGTAGNLFVAYNVTDITNLSASRTAVPVDLAWDAVPGMRYRIYRDVAGGTPVELAVSTTNSYADVTLAWQQSAGYQVAGIADFTDSFTGQAVSVTGPRSVIVQAPALPPLSLQFDDAAMAADGTLEYTLGNQSSITVTGRYLDALGAVDIVASDGSQTLSSTADDGRIRLVLPVNGNAVWTVDLTEQLLSDRTASATIRLQADTTPPLVSIDGAASRSVDADVAVITGLASDAHSGLSSLSVSSDRFPGQHFGVLQGAGGTFSAEIPLSAGNNVLTVSAVDASGNSAAASIDVDRLVSLAPTVSISAPQNGSVSASERITLQGTVYTALAPEQVRIALGAREQFASGTPGSGGYAFSFDNVALDSGLNRLLVEVSTPAGDAAAAVTVSYDPDPPVVTIPPPVISLTSPRGDYVNGDSVTVAGSVTSFAGEVTVTLDGVPLNVVGADSSQGNFKQVVDLSGFTGGSIVMDLVAQDAQGNSTQRSITLLRDTVAPVIAIATPGVVASPAVNAVHELPLQLAGSVVDSDLAGLSVNGRSVTVLPGAAPDSFDFNVGLDLVPGIDQPVTLEAWDLAGNRTSLDLLFNASVSADVDIIAPRDGETRTVSGASSTLEVVARVDNLNAGDTLWASVDGGAPVAMTLDTVVGRAFLPLAHTGGRHDVLVQVQDANAAVVAARRSVFTLVNEDATALAVTRTEPANAARGIEPNAFVAVFFNKPIDPARLQLNVKSTAHGLTYDLAAQSGANPLLEGNLATLVQVDYDQQPVAGSLSFLPGGRGVAFYPGEDFAYDADVFVDVLYDGQELERFSFEVRALPTLAQGFVADTLLQPIGGIEVSLPDYNRVAVTDGQGNFSFGFGDLAGDNLPGGRHRLVINPGMKDPRYGQLETLVNFEAGRLTQLDLKMLPIINPEEPYRRIDSAQARALLAGGELELDLSQADLLFANGDSGGNIHVQVLPRHLVSFDAQPSVAPHWLYVVQPSGVKVSGTFSAIMTMPDLYGSRDYIPDDGTPVLIAGFDDAAKRLVPIGAGRVQQGRVISESSLRAASLDYLGYVLLDVEAQALTQQYLDGTLGFDQLIAALDRLASAQ